MPFGDLTDTGFYVMARVGSKVLYSVFHERPCDQFGAKQQQLQETVSRKKSFFFFDVLTPKRHTKKRFYSPYIAMIGATILYTQP